MAVCLLYMITISLNPTIGGKNAGYAQVVQQLQEYIEANQTFAKLVNQTFIESGHGPNSSQPIYYNDMYNFLNQILNFAPNGSQAYHTSDTIFTFTETVTGNQLVTESKTITWFNQWINVWCQYLDSYNSTTVIPTWFVNVHNMYRCSNCSLM